LAAALVGCNAETAPATGVAVPNAAAPTPDASRLAADDELCSRRTFETLIVAVNASDEARLASLFGGSFLWLTLKGSTSYESRVAVHRLLAVGRSGERWSLTHLDVNGRGSYYEGVNYGVVIRRSGPGVKDPQVDSAGKGVLDCPGGRVRIFGLGD
jgi:hypothetical protein